MPADTPDQQITYPIDGDSADNPVAFLAMLGDVEPRLVREYTDEADRTARMLTLASGDISTLVTPTIGPARTEVYNGTNHVSLYTRSLYASLRKSADETVNNSITLQDDNNLLVALPTAGTFAFDLDLVYSSSTVADIKVAMTWPALAVATWTGMGLATTATSGTGDLTITGSQTSAAATAFGGTGTANFVPLKMTGEITMGGTAGNLVLQWAQQNAEVSNTIMRARSRMQVWRVL